MKVQTGDIFCTKNPMWLGRAINAAQRFWSADNESEYGHAGIIIRPTGATFESLGTVRVNHINAYRGQKVLIGRARDILTIQHRGAINQVREDHEGLIYPFWRLAFHMLPPLAKYISSGKFPVCSELTVKEEILAGVKDWGNRWQGKNPDHVADAIRRWDRYDVVYEGIW